MVHTVVINPMVTIGIAGAIISLINSVLWFNQWTHERQWKSERLTRICLDRMWGHLILTALCAIFGVVGWAVIK